MAMESRLAAGRRSAKLRILREEARSSEERLENRRKLLQEENVMRCIAELEAPQMLQRADVKARDAALLAALKRAMFLASVVCTVAILDKTMDRECC